jgi:iron-sulfur cluster repair protein YtfE (RIC family)
LVTSHSPFCTIRHSQNSPHCIQSVTKNKDSNKQAFTPDNMSAALPIEAEAEAEDRMVEVEDPVWKRRKELFGDCALIEIIHLHDCLRRALKALESDVSELASVVVKGNVNKQVVADLERRVASRFKVIWSVFRAHSQAEDEFIWPALQSKTQGLIRGSPECQAGEPSDSGSGQPTGSTAGTGTCTGTAGAAKTPDVVVEQEEYEEDHADEERMFSEMDGLLSKLRAVLLQSRVPGADSTDPSPVEVNAMARDISEQTKLLSQHLMIHLEKEETQCLPLVVKHMSKSEIHELVGNIMGKRSAGTHL